MNFMGLLFKFSMALTLSNLQIVPPVHRHKICLFSVFPHLVNLLYTGSTILALPQCRWVLSVQAMAH